MKDLDIKTEFWRIVEEVEPDSDGQLLYTVTRLKTTDDARNDTKPKPVGIKHCEKEDLVELKRIIEAALLISPGGSARVGVDLQRVRVRWP